MTCLSLCTLIFFTIFGVHTAEKCITSPRCSCQFGQDGELPVAASGSDARNIGFAAAVGSLGSMVLAGGGFALWHCIKHRSTPAFNKLYERPASNSSTGPWMNEEKQRPTPRYNPTRGSSPFSLHGDEELSGNYTSSSNQSPSSHSKNVYRMGRVWSGLS